MADGNYDEVTNTIYIGESRENIDPMFHWDLHFPERISRLRLNPEFSSSANRRQRRPPRDRCALRYKTQPITFDEITEVDEDTSGQAAAAAAAAATGSAAQQQPEVQEITAEMKTNFKNTMTGFSRSMDGLVAGAGSRKGGAGSDKENTPCESADRLTAPDQDDGKPEARLDTSGCSGQTKAPAVDYFRSVGWTSDGVRQRRKRINRKLHYRNTVVEVPEAETKPEETENP